MQQHRAFKWLMRYRNGVVLLLIVCMWLLYGFSSVLPLPPQSVHQWRQADCLSMADCYYEEGMNFFEPRLHHQFRSEGLAVGELPILAYATAVGYHVVGKKPWVYRSIVLLCWLLGLLALFKAFELLLDDVFWAAWLALLMNTSPVLLFYANNFLSDVPALSFAFVGLYLLARYRHKPQQKWLWWMSAAFAMAMLLKVTAAITVLSVLGLWFFELVLPIRFGKGRRLFQQRWQALLPMLSALALAACWYFWAAAFNNSHGLLYFSNWTYPVWTLEPERIDRVWHMVHEYWWRYYFKPVTLEASFVLLLLVLALFRKQNAFFPGMALLTVLGVGGFVMLQFDTLHDHDYYTINLMILVLWGFAAFLALLGERYPKVFKSLLFKGVLLIFLIANMTHASRRFHSRYDGNNYANRLPALEALAPKLESLGVAADHKVIVIPDDSPNITLQILNRKGWTRYGTGSEDRIREWMEDGAQWLIVHDSLPDHYTHFEPFMVNGIHTKEGPIIYPLE